MPTAALGLALAMPFMGGVGRPSWVPDGAAAFWDFAADRYWNAPYTFARASSGLALSLAGVWLPYASGDMRRTARGVLIEPARTNLVLRSAFTGAVVGVVGAGGSLPSGMSWSGGGGTGTVEVLSIFTDALGLSRIRLKLSVSSNTSGVTAFPRFRFVNGIALADATPWTGSAYYNLLSTTHPLTAMVEGGTPYDAMGSAVKAIPLGENFVSGTGIRTASGGTVVLYQIGPALPAGEAFECVIELSAPQMEQAANASSPILTTGTAATRVNDDLDLILPSAGNFNLTVTFDDNSTQTVAASGGAYQVPTNLSRPQIKTIAAVPA